METNDHFITQKLALLAESDVAVASSEIDTAWVQLSGQFLLAFTLHFQFGSFFLELRQEFTNCLANHRFLSVAANVAAQHNSHLIADE